MNTKPWVSVFRNPRLRLREVTRTYNVRKVDKVTGESVVLRVGRGLEVAPVPGPTSNGVRWHGDQ